MATLLKINKGKSVTPEYIRDMLFYFNDAAHKFHQDTKNGWEHDAMGKLYEGIAEFKDDIPEKIMGYMGGERIGGLNKIDIPEYKSKQDSIDLSKSLIDFAYEIYEWAGEKKIL